MKKYLLSLVLFISIVGCNGGGASDSAGITSGSAIDTTKAPSGVDNSSVISTDTSAMNTQKSIDKGDSARKKNE